MHQSLIKLCGAALAALLASASLAQDKVRFGTNWRAQGAHGGWYQAAADGTFKRLGLACRDRPGRAAGEQSAAARRRASSIS